MIVAVTEPLSRRRVFFVGGPFHGELVEEFTKLSIDGCGFSNGAI
jgi:hypothetical protein